MDCSINTLLGCLTVRSIIFLSVVPSHKNVTFRSSKEKDVKSISVLKLCVSYGLPHPGQTAMDKMCYAFAAHESLGPFPFPSGAEFLKYRV